MKKLFLNLMIAFAVIAFASCNSKKANGVYGTEFTVSNPMTIDDVVEQMKDKDTMNVQVQGEITAVCKHSGCWITFNTKDGEQIYINTKDESFSLPKDVVGKTAIANGKALSIAKQKEIEIANGEDPDDIDWIDNISIEATGIVVK
ncbi:MAG: DUF4920 domain-containing protein [Bacteroidetes bacterium]|nr:DUF4920 domain-containing protein [Bacteroidota bacterium]